jgi:hypothetical protein
MYIPKADGVTFFVFPIHMVRSVSTEISCGWFLRKKQKHNNSFFFNVCHLEDAVYQNRDVIGEVWEGRHTSYNMPT